MSPRAQTKIIDVKALQNKSFGLCRNYSFLLRADDSFRVKWDVLIILVTIWICFTLPVEISFEPAYLTG